MGTRPYVLLSCAMSVDGFIDDTTAERLLLSNDAAPRFVNPAAFPDGPGHRMVLAEVQAVGDVAVLRYLPGKQAAAGAASGRSAA